MERRPSSCRGQHIRATCELPTRRHRIRLGDQSRHARDSGANPGRAQTSRAEAYRARAAEFVQWPDKLYLYRPDRWSRVNLGWDPDTGVFLGWYVNFELPPRPTANGLVSKDLVLDLCVNADRIWSWKDEDDYLRALDDGILDPTIRAPIQEEASRVLRELDAHTGPFADSLTTFRPPSSWSIPRLPTTHCLNGDQWTLGDTARSRRAQP